MLGAGVGIAPQSAGREFVADRRGAGRGADYLWRLLALLDGEIGADLALAVAMLAALVLKEWWVGGKWC